MSNRSTILLASAAAMLAAVASAPASHAQVDAHTAPDVSLRSTALHRAAEHGDTSAIERQLATGATVDVRDERAMTPLHRAAVTGQLKAAALLLDRGADPNARAEGDMTPLHYASMLAHPELGGLLVRRGARTDARNASGMMPLHLAASDKVVVVLVDAGADVNALTSKGFTPLHTARHGLVARALVDHKADIRIRTPKGRTAMETAGIESFEPRGISVHSVMMGRLRGMMGQMPVTLTNVSRETMRDLRLAARSQGCTIEITPPIVSQLLPGQNADYVLTMIRNTEAAPAEYPVYVTLSAGDSQIGVTDLKVDTRMTETPQDQGMIRLTKAKIRPASSRWFYLVYASAPLLVVGVWLFLRRR